MITLANIDIHGENARTAAAKIAILTNSSLRTFAFRRIVRTAVITKKITNSVSPKPSTPARPVTRTMNAAATAEIKKVTTVPSCSPRVRFHGVVGSGIAVDC